MKDYFLPIFDVGQQVQVYRKVPRTTRAYRWYNAVTLRVADRQPEHRVAYWWVQLRDGSHEMFGLGQMRKAKGAPW